MTNVIEFNGVRYVRQGRVILNSIDWCVAPSDRWVILGPNGAGKSTLIKLACGAEYPSAGSVQILGETLGRTALSELKPRIGVVTRASAAMIPNTETVRDVVLTAAYGVAGRWREEYDSVDVEQADAVLAGWGLSELRDSAFGTLSDGEQKRALTARAVMTDPELLLLDEPTASIDLGAREQLVTALGEYAASPAAPALVLVTHHVEEIPSGFTHALLLGHGGEILEQGEIGAVLTAENLTRAFGVPLQLSESNGRYSATAQ